VTTRRTGLRSVTIFALTAACLLLLLTTRAPLYGRDRPKPPDYALIIGTVWGPDDRPIYGIEVNIRRTDQKKPKWHVYSDHHGVFAQRVPVRKADYEIWADTKGVKLLNGKHLQPNPRVTIHVDSNERVDTGLHLQ
jgi:hypothetical protein